MNRQKQAQQFVDSLHLRDMVASRETRSQLVFANSSPWVPTADVSMLSHYLCNMIFLNNLFCCAYKHRTCHLQTVCVNKTQDGHSEQRVTHQDIYCPDDYE